MDIEEYVKTLLENLQRISVVWRNRINKLLKSMGKTIKTLFKNMTEKLKIIFNKYEKENQSYKPFHLCNWRPCYLKISLPPMLPELPLPVEIF